MKKILIILGVFVAVCAGCRRDSYRIEEGGVWNTTYRIIYSSPLDLSDSIRAVMHTVEMSLSPFCDSSVIAAVNRGERVTVDSLVAKVFRASVDISRRSGGAFDPTVAPLVNLWGFGYSAGSQEPDSAAIDSLLERVGITECRLSGDTLIKKHPLTEFNFSAITKGLGCDMVAEMLHRNGCRDYLVEIGGEIAMRGLNSRHQPWHIMVDMPDTAMLHSQLTVIAPGDCGIATSGNYRNFKVTSRGIVWHTINPVTGHPAPARLLSATVIAPTAMIADALATSCMAMDPDSAMAMIELYPLAHALFVMPDSTIITSASFPLP